MKLHLYARVSTIDSNVDQMVDEMLRWCRTYGHEVVSITKDKESGTISLADRKNFNDILSRIPFDDADGLLVLALDRISRNWYDENIIEKAFTENWEHCKLVSVFDRIELGTPSGRFIFRIQMGVSCYEVERMKERQRIGIERAKKQKGKYKGRKPGSKNKKTSRKAKK